MSVNGLNRLAWTAIVIAQSNAFLHTPSLSTTHRMTNLSSSASHQGRTRGGVGATTSRARRCTTVRGVHRSRRGVALPAKNAEKEEEEVDAAALVQLREQKLEEWRAMMSSGEMAEATRMALDMDMIEQEEARETGNRRVKRKGRNQGASGKGEMKSNGSDMFDVSGLDEMFSAQKEDDWRDGAAAVGSTKTTAAPAAPAKKKRVTNAQDGNARAAKMAAGLGLQVVPPKAEVHDTHEQEYAKREDEEGLIGAGGGGGEGRLAGVREVIAAVRKLERDGKENAEQVVATVVSAAERDGMRDDRLFSFTLKALARMGRLDLSSRVQEMRDRFIETKELYNHDRATTAGLAVAFIRAGDEATALEVLQSATTPALGLSPVLNDDMLLSDTLDKEEQDEDSILAAEADILPELLAYYLERAQKESSQEASKGIRSVVDRALRRGDFAPDGGAFSNHQTWALLSRPLAVGAYNQLIRRLGKADRLSDVFEVLDRMAELEVAPDHETLEFVTNAAVKEVVFETRAISMKSLPSGKDSLPEVVFVGRSNVGKSSLVNMLVNRKALAPTSAVPGFTQHFNYYAVNKGRRRSPSFFLVDVPGLGYAKADDGRMDSWKSTLQRYLGVRETLRVVFHLVDVRTGLQPADANLISLMMNENKGRSSYVMVITKCDKISETKRLEVEKQIRKALDDNMFPASTPIITTSAKSRHGRVEMLSYLRLVFDVDRRKKGSVTGDNNSGGSAQQTKAAPAHGALPAQ